MIWSRPELRVMFVCTANVCRSPLAEGLLRHRLRALGLADRVHACSAGTHAAQKNRRPDPRVEELAAEAGVSLAGIRAQMLTPKLIERSDYVLVMERRHMEGIERLCSGNNSNGGNVFNRKKSDTKHLSAKVQLLGSFLPASNGSTEDIPDPYFGDRQGFYNVYQMIDSALTGFLHHIGESDR